MAFTLEKVIPWGRSLEEYRRMFSLDSPAVCGRVLGCGDGPASFNAQWTALGGEVVSCDPLYQFTGPAIESRLEVVRQQVMAQTRAHAHQFVWNIFASPDELEAERLAVAQRFLDDYEAGAEQGRYVTASLPSLPFESDSFDLALVSHFLFLYSTQLTLEFHLESVRELMRVAREVRVFPLLNLDAQTSSYLEPVMEGLRGECILSVERVDYEFQRGGNQMLRIKRGAA